MPVHESSRTERKSPMSTLPVNQRAKLTRRGCGVKLGLVLCCKSETFSVFEGTE